MADEALELKQRVLSATFKALTVVVEDLAGRAQRDAPIDEGTLRGSMAIDWIVNRRRFTGAGARATAEAVAQALVKGGQAVTVDAEVSFNTIYAARQHEELDWEHPKGGRAKYLEANLLAQAGRYNRVLDMAVQAAQR
jgi:hypothetical protein